jgi:hypothetical protein
VQVGLEGLETFLEQQEQEDGKGQHPLAREVRRSPPGPGTQARIRQPLTPLMNELQGTQTQVAVLLHPKGTSRKYLLCTFK